MDRITADARIRTGLGLATNTFRQVLRAGELNERELIAWAAGRGFSWVELRDTNVEKIPEELEEIRELADALGVRIHYAWDNSDTLSVDDKFLKGMDNAAIFGPGTCCRVLIAPGGVSGQRGYTAGQMEKIIPVLRTYGKRAKELGIHLCFENAMEPLSGDGESYYGMSEILSAVPDICATLDAANATSSTTMVNPSQEEILDYYRRFRDQIFYYHLKVTRQHEVLDTVEAEGDFSFRALFDAFSGNPEMKICLEIPQQSNLRKMLSCVERSLQVLEETGKDAEQ